MATVQASGVVDMSGVVGSMLASYRAVLVEYRRMVTGDVAALTSAAGRHADQASTVDSSRDELRGRASRLGGSWQGDAYRAFHASVARQAGALTELGAVLHAQSQSLGGAANALRAAQSTMDNLVSWFDQQARALIAQSAAAAAGAASAFTDAARQLGESAVAAARQCAQRLGETLTQLFA